MASYTPVKLAYDTYDPANGVDGSLSPIIFIHGLTASKDHWGNIPQVIANATRRKVYAIDSRNHGDSEWSDVFDFDANVVDLLNFLDTIEVPKAILIGHSMGGITSIKTALKKPERVEKIVVEDMSVRQVDKSMLGKIIDLITVLQKAFDQFTPEIDLEEAQKVIAKVFMDNVPPELAPRGNVETMGMYKIPMKRGPDGRLILKANIKVILNSLKKTDKLMSDPEGVYECPAVFIYGALSPFLVGADQHEIKKYFPKADFVSIEEAAHSVHVDRPVEFTDAVLKALS